MTIANAKDNVQPKPITEADYLDTGKNFLITHRRKLITIGIFLEWMITGYLVYRYVHAFHRDWTGTMQPNWSNLVAWTTAGVSWIGGIIWLIVLYHKDVKKFFCNLGKSFTIRLGKKLTKKPQQFN